MLEDRLLDLYAHGKQKICVDGPSGSGKTSLVKTSLHNSKKNFIYSSITRRMNWNEFSNSVYASKNLLQNSDYSEFEVKIGTDGIVPILSLAHKKFKTQQSEHSPSPSELADIITRHKVKLIIDDTEKADDTLLEDLSDFAKVLSNHSGEQCIFIGTGNIFGRITNADGALHGRITPVTVPSISKPHDAYILLSKGLKKLDFEYPHERNSDPRSDWKRCRQIVFRCTNGLPKHLNYFGEQLCSHVLGTRNEANIRKKIDESDFKHVSNSILSYHLNKFAIEFEGVKKIINSSIEMKLIFIKIFEKGINEVTTWESLRADCLSEMSGESFDNCKKNLISEKIFVETGKMNEVVFAFDPFFYTRLFNNR